MIKYLLFFMLVPFFLFGSDIQLVDGHIKAHTEVFGDSAIEPETTKINASLHMANDFESIIGEIQIKAKDLISNNSKRDEHMYSTLEYNAYPSISFKINKVLKSGKNYKILGQLTLHGVSKNIEVLSKIDNIDGSLFDLNTNFTIKMTDYKIEPPKLLFLTVRNEVDLDIKLKFKKH